MTKAKRRSSRLVEPSAEHKKVKAAVAAAAFQADLRLVDLVMDLPAVHLMADKPVAAGAVKAAAVVVVAAPAVADRAAAVKCASE